MLAFEKNFLNHASMSAAIECPFCNLPNSRVWIETSRSYTRPARALDFRVDAMYTGHFSLATDVFYWNNAIDQTFGPAFFIANPGLGTTTGYVFSWEANDWHLRISRIDGEILTTVGATTNIILPTTAGYHFVVSSHDGNTFLGQIFSTNDLKNPLAGVLAYDPNYGSPGGWMGLLTYDGGEFSVNGANVT